jgi:hypothetical protein
VGPRAGLDTDEEEMLLLPGIEVAALPVDHCHTESALRAKFFERAPKCWIPPQILQKSGLAKFPQKLKQGLELTDDEASGKNRQPSGKAMRLRDTDNACLGFIIVTVIVLIIIWYVSAI